MRILKILLIALSFIVYLVIAVFFHILITFFKPSRRWWLMSKASCALIGTIGRIMGLRIFIKRNREFLKQGGNFFIARHVGYIDGLVLGGLMPAIFVSKKEIQKWPLIGQVIAISGTIFIDRKNKSKLIDSLLKIENLLIHDTSIIDFPEGTSTDGTVIRDFQSTYFRSPILARASVVPLGIYYRRINGRPFSEEDKDLLYWYGDMNFFDHFWNLLGFKTIEVEVVVSDKIKVSGYQDTSAHRKALSRICYDALSAMYKENKNVTEVAL